MASKPSQLLTKYASGRVATPKAPERLPDADRALLLDLGGQPLLAAVPEGRFRAAQRLTRNTRPRTRS